MKRLVAKNILKKAENNIYSFGCGDASDKVSRINARFGLGKIIYSLDKINVNTAGVICVFTPDGGITRNKERWQSGFSYGCFIRWPDVNECGKLLAFPQIKPNACGMLVAQINKIPKIKTLCNRLHDIEKEGLKVESDKLKLNVGVSNHFIEVCKVKESKTTKVPQSANFAIIHTSPSEFKSELYDFIKWHEAGGQWIETPFGKFLVLEDESAEKYLKKYYEIEAFSIKKRLLLAKKLFGDIKVISNPTHQGLYGRNEARLGVYKVRSKELYPVAFRWNLEVYLVKPTSNISIDVLKDQGIFQKAVDSGHLDILASADMLPHGGGYHIPFPANGWKVMKNGRKRLYMNSVNGNDFVFSSPSEIPYFYRGLKVADKIDNLKLGTVVAKLKQLYTLKY